MPFNNSIGGNVWQITDADPTPVKDGITWVNSMVWQGYANTTDYCLVKDGNGDTVFESIASTEFTPILVSYPEPVPIRNLTVTHLDTGKLTVFIA